MKISIAIFYFFSLLSCGTAKHSESNIAIYSTIQYEDHILYYGVDGKDTIVFVAHSDFINNCYLSVDFINRKGLSKVSEIVTQSGDSIAFTYSMPTVNNSFVDKVTVGSGSPGQLYKRNVYTYSSLPFLIIDCSAIVR